MKNVSFETAKALRDAGFPQPEPAFGQQWYFPETKELFLVTFVYSNGKVDYCMEGSQVVMLEDMPEGAIFAPQAHDILSALMDYEKLSLATEGISEFLEIIILPEEIAKKWMEFNSKPA